MTNCMTSNIENVKSLSPLAKLIVTHDITDMSKAKIFNDLTAKAIACGDYDAFKDLIDKSEIEILEVRKANGEKVTTAKGKWIRGRVSLDADGLPNKTYTANRDTILKAMRLGKTLTDEFGKPLGKTALAKSYAKESTPKSKFELCVDYAKRISQHWADFTESEQDAIINCMRGGK